MVLCRQNPSPFNVVMDRSLIKEWKNALPRLFLPRSKSSKNVFQIQKYVMMKYKKMVLYCVAKLTVMIIGFRLWFGIKE